jgi:tetratricopeptide (TPR) repeat protein
MSNAVTFRKKASEFEQLKQIDQAIALYAKAIMESEAGGESVEVGLYNKVGDLALRRGQVPDAVRYFERAVEHYESAGLLNNAIALCNKILRNAPGRAGVYFTLGRISARKGLRGEATRYFLEYATRLQQDGRLEEGIRALTEVLDLMPELNDVRTMVEDLAMRSGIVLSPRLTPLCSERMPTPASSSALGDQRSQDLVFLDLDDSAAALRDPVAVAATMVAPPPESKASLAMAGLPLLDAWNAPSVAGSIDDESARLGRPDLPEAIDVPGDHDEEPHSPAGAPFRLDPHVFPVAGELPPLRLADAIVEAGLVAAHPAGTATSCLDTLRASVAHQPRNWLLRRRLAEALFEAGEQDAALHELETAQLGMENDGDVAAASGIADLLLHRRPDLVSYHQKRVELAVRSGDAQRLRVAYLDLADALMRLREDGRARAVYVRVLEIDPYDERARGALGAAAPPVPVTSVSPDDERLGKAGVSRSLGEDDFEGHYDLGVAYKVMGLLDNAVAEFQKALHSRTHRLPAYEALGQCFVEQARYQVAATVLSRALHEPGVGDQSRVGILYLLGYSCEALQRKEEARGYFQRVYETDINFRDVAARLAAIGQASR